MKPLLALLLMAWLAGCASTPSRLYAVPSPPVEQPVEQSAFQPVTDTPPLPLGTQLEKADRALREARLTDAEVLYRRLTKTHPELPDVWLRLGNVYTRQGQLIAAVRIYKEGLKHSHDDARLWYNLAVARVKQAVRTLEAASRTLPPDSHYRPRIRKLHDALLSGEGVK